MSALRVQDVVDGLSHVGLNPAQASIYVHLVMAGPSKASEVAERSRTRRTEAYRILQELVNRGLVAATLGRPTKFEAVSPERLFDLLLGGEEDEWERRVRAREEILAGLEAIRSRAVPPTVHGVFRILQGRAEAYRTAQRLIRDAAGLVQAASTHPADQALVEGHGFLDLLVRRALQGVRAEALLLPGAPALPALAAYKDAPTLKVRTLILARTVRLVAVDGREAVVWAASDGSDRRNATGDVAVWTNAEDLVGLNQAFFERLWAEAHEPAPLAPTGAAGLPR